MTPTIEASAEGMMRNFGAEAAGIAQSQIRKYRLAGDAEGLQTWEAILKAVQEKAARPQVAA